MPDTGSCALKCISDGFHMEEWNERAGLKETRIRNKCASHSPSDLGFFPSFGMCVCEHGLVGGKFPVIPFIQPGLRTSIYLHLQLLQTPNTTQPETVTDAHLTSCS